jgi:membrane fusion protein (multidrug efflux system)
MEDPRMPVSIPFRGLLPFALALLAACTACSPPLERPHEAPALPVRIEAAARAPFQPSLAGLGVVRPATTVEVTAPARGRLSYPPRFAAGLPSGAAVRAGEVVAVFSAPEAELSLAEARLQVDSANAELTRHQRVFDAGLISAAQLDRYKSDAAMASERLKAARQQSARLSLRAPVSGHLLVDRRIPAGFEVEAGTVLARIAAGGALRVEGRAAAADLERLHPGLRVRFLSASGAAVGEAVIREVSPLVEAGGTVSWLAEVTDPTGLAAPGEGVDVRIELDARDQALTVPEEALVLGEGGASVFVAERKSGHLQARRQPVETGARGSGRIEVLRGLSPGDKVIVDGVALLSEGARVTQIEDGIEDRKE